MPSGRRLRRILSRTPQLFRKICSIVGGIKTTFAHVPTCINTTKFKYSLINNTYLILYNGIIAYRTTLHGIIPPIVTHYVSIPVAV